MLGNVWGIMNQLINIREEKKKNMDVVEKGIEEEMIENEIGIVEDIKEVVI